MEYDLFELFFRKFIDDALIFHITFDFFQIDKYSIVTEDKFWIDSMPSSARIGIDIDHTEKGMLTSAGFQSNFNVDDNTLVRAAGFFADQTGSDTVIADFRKYSEENMWDYLTFHPGGMVTECLDISYGNIFDLKLSNVSFPVQYLL
ncbi:hypothetical protein U1839_22360 [Sphingomonas sp. RT2P30]|uniref:hypothetical protein n=1 Tax=Parasphingomonas halimpatiens TaxID=3096162 RepID=UPI002FC95995